MLMRKNFDIPTIRERMAGMTGQKYWRSLEEIAETEAFQDFLQHEFPQGADQWFNPVSRRNFLKLMGASLALGGLTACTGVDPEKIVPYVEQPEDVIPGGKPLFFATAMTLGGVAMGLLAESHQGRPTKLEGNPEHPASLGATSAIAQATVLDLYDPDRSQNIIQNGVVSSWTNFLSSLNARLANRKVGLRILTETITSPSLADQLQTVLDRFPQARWHQYEPINRDNARQGALIAFGRDVNVVYRFGQADVILSLDDDFFSDPGAGVRYAHDFSQKRRVRAGEAGMNRLYMAESTPTITGAMADHHLPVRPAQMLGLAQLLAAALGLDVSVPEGKLSDIPDQWVSAVAEDLKAHAGSSLVVAGNSQPPAVHALVHAINHALGNAGQTVVYTLPLEANPVSQLESLQELLADIDAGLVDALIIIEANPVYNTPVDLNFADALNKVGFTVRLGLHQDETSNLCQWHLPARHYLESWGDALAFDGTVTLMQPLIEPLSDASASPCQLLATILGQPDLTNYDLVRDYWAGQEQDDFESFWKQGRHDGLITDSALPLATVAVDIAAVRATVAAVETGSSDLEITFRPDPTVWDGRFANNGWLQELPKPLTKLTWDNVALVSPATAEKLSLTTEDVVTLDFKGRLVEAPVWVMPGQANDTITLHLGYGRTQTGRVGQDVGVNAYLLRTTDALWAGSGLKVDKTGEQYRLATTQNHFNMEDRALVWAGTIGQFEETPDFPQQMVHELPEISLMPQYDYSSYAWGMVVDLNVCNGCNACVTACQAENNIPIVGKEQVVNGREMHWIRVDAYFKGNLDDPKTYHQPVMCQHCEQAPCEVVCPVGATVHDHEGLNVMVYNRCIGTRYCSNNCPYKVRRYNFLQYSDQEIETLKMQRNPDVTVRTRGVMEKCTFCVQRISRARIEAKKEGRRIADGEVVTACQAACPTDAIVFGDINNPNSQVSQAKAEPHNYGILTELNTRPRTSYLVRLRNPNQKLEV
ncbi:MAG: TAT-variant-translocated molybdopterin oxidoreductase [Anaerolineae bacterium]|nr:TAT-variant-translocated molybdopterin oxidoreductase [Anaerolineae bacterium]